MTLQSILSHEIVGYTLYQDCNEGTPCQISGIVLLETRDGRECLRPFFYTEQVCYTGLSQYAPQFRYLRSQEQALIPRDLEGEHLIIPGGRMGMYGICGKHMWREPWVHYSWEDFYIGAHRLRYILPEEKWDHLFNS